MVEKFRRFRIKNSTDQSLFEDQQTKPNKIKSDVVQREYPPIYSNSIFFSH